MNRPQVVHDISQYQQSSILKKNNLTPSHKSQMNQETVDVNELEQKFTHAREAMLALQHENGHWCFPLEADCTIPAEYILMMHFMNEIDVVLERKIARFIRDKQDMNHGGWPLYYGGEFDISCTIKSYYALKLVGDSPDDAHMKSAREAILQRGGAAKANVFTRLLLTMYRQIPWRAVPVVPAELVLLPKWAPFH